MEKYYGMIISAFIGAASGLFASYWRTRYTVKSQDLSKRLDDLCNAISKLEELACLYWGYPNKLEIKPSPHYILGYKTKISLLVTYLNNQYTQFNRNKVSLLLTDFFDACTGGEFGNPDINYKPERFRIILISAEKLKIELLTIRCELY